MRRSERLRRKGWRVQSLTLRRGSQSQYAESSRVMSRREGQRVGPGNLTFQGWGSSPDKSRCGSECGWLEWSKDEGPWN